MQRHHLRQNHLRKRTASNIPRNIGESDGTKAPWANSGLNETVSPLSIAQTDAQQKDVSNGIDPPILSERSSMVDTRVDAASTALVFKHVTVCM